VLPDETIELLPEKSHIKYFSDIANIQIFENLFTGRKKSLKSAY
jgi:hypothetical protein